MFRRKHHEVHGMDKIHTPEEEQQKVRSEMKCMKIFKLLFFSRASHLRSVHYTDIVCTQTNFHGSSQVNSKDPKKQYICRYLS